MEPSVEPGTRISTVLSLVQRSGIVAIIVALSGCVIYVGWPFVLGVVWKCTNPRLMSLTSLLVLTGLVAASLASVLLFRAYGRSKDGAGEHEPIFGQRGEDVGQDQPKDDDSASDAPAPSTGD